MMADAFDNDVRGALYSFFVERERPPVAPELARILDASVIDVETSLHRLAEARVIVLAPGTPYVWMANPMSALATPYEVHVDGRTFWGNCIWDALGIVAMLGGTGTVSASCPDCAHQLAIDVAAGRLEPADAGYVVHYAVPALHWWDDIGFN